MKKPLILTLLALPLLLGRCMDPCPGDILHPELRSATATIPTSPVSSDDLRLNLSLEVGYVKKAQAKPLITLPSLIQRAYACSPGPIGFTRHTQIKTISLTCDKPIRGFAPGENILTTSALIYYHTWPRTTLGKWMLAVNEGWANSKDYDISVGFIPAGTTVPADDYTFTFTMTLRGGRTFTRTFDPVTISAL